jgi:hypothetical protein
MSPAALDAFMVDIPRFTYRKGFSPLSSEHHCLSLKSDTHWGCCIRCGQSLLAQYMCHCVRDHPLHYQGRFRSQSVLSLFDDIPDAPFSIHNICRELVTVGGHEGAWVKGSHLASAFSNLLTKFNFPVYVATNACFCVSTAISMFSPDSSLLCLIPTMCGSMTFDDRCFDAVALAVLSGFGLGFITGLKGKARYFVGTSRGQFHYFDPHVTKKFVAGVKDHGSLFDVKLESMPIADVEPSVLLAFAFPNTQALIETMTVLRGFEFSPFAIVDEEMKSEIQTEDVGDWGVVELVDG